MSHRWPSERLTIVDTGDSWSDERLLSDRRRPSDSFALLYRRHVVAVLRFVAACGADADTAADVVSETFAVALSKRYRYRARHPTARLWLLGIAARELAEARRRTARERQYHQRLALEAIRLSPSDRDDYAVMHDSPVTVDALLSELPDAQRSAVTARVIGEREYADVARLLGMSEPATRKNVSRGLATLRAHLGRNR
jgi:RNA polymerase sigma factor (sigma-70 family)